MSVLLITTDAEGFITHQRLESWDKAVSKLEEDYDPDVCREQGYNPQPHVITESLNVVRFEQAGYQY